MSNQTHLEKLTKEIEQENCEATVEFETLTAIETEPKEEEMTIEYLDEEHIIEEETIMDESERLNETEQAEATFDESVDLINSSSKQKYPRKRLKDPIKCPKCEKLFYYKSYFAFHYKDVHQEQACEVCMYCGKTFKNTRRLNSHILIHNVGEKKFKCPYCEKQFNYSGDMLRHKRIHEQIKPYECHFDNCGKKFVQSYALKLHLDVHNNVRFKCDSCGSEFSVKTTLKNHMKKCINGISPYRTMKNRRTTKDPNTVREKYKCFADDCDRVFSSRKYLGVHLEKHHQMKLTNFETTCLECQKVFENVGDYAKHVKIHSCLFVCSMCKLRYKTEEKLSAHMEKVHKEGDDRPFSCEECGARFKRLEHLRGHQLYKHSNVKKFECSHCPLKFRQRGEYNVHMR